MAQVAYRTSSASAKVGSSNSNFNLVINKPTGTTSGDELFAHIGIDSTSASISSVPSGWTLLSSKVTNFQSFLYWKIAGGSEPSDYTWGVSVLGTTSAIGITTSITNPHQTTPNDAESSKENAASTTATGTAITPTTSPESLLIMFVSHLGEASVSGYAVATSNPSWTEAYDDVVNSGANDVGISMAYANRDFLTSTGSPTATLSASEFNVVHTVSVRPAGFTIAPPVLNLTMAFLAPVISSVQSIALPLLTLVMSFKVPTITQGTNPVSNESKNTEAFTNPSKNVETFTNTGKSSGSWNNVDKT